ncbi:MAG: sigma-70 family RNA polymerase sigma factor [Myxococcota bacterium]|nr:sigma-70 family RNA polymerase sigma factor [Myxococcota bacterium]MDW8362093.1 sigma-70 family RNA polymerase sigma factor [Myxococcales bacterium]
MTEEEDERQFVERLRRRDEAAFNRFVREHQDRVYRLVVRMLGDRDEALDVTQDVFVSVFKSIDTFRGESRLSTWLYRVAVNHCRNRIKYMDRRGRGASTRFEDGRDGATGATGAGVRAGGFGRPDEAAEAGQLQRIVREAMDELDEEHRTLLVLRDVEDLSYEEIGAITGLVEGTVKSRLHRARAALLRRVRQRMGEEGSDDE